VKYFLSTKNEPNLSYGYYYMAPLLNKVQGPIEDDPLLKMEQCRNIEEFLIHEHGCKRRVNKMRY
jgi:8-oxo-dGTP diphosphatase